MISRILLIIIPCLILTCTQLFAAQQGTVNRLIESTFTSTKVYADPFNEVQLDMLVTAPDGSQLRVPAFWGGKENWRVRYSSPQAGTHRWKLDCSDKTNRDLHGVEGTIELAPYVGDHPLYKHGFVKIAADKRHLQYGDGTPFFWLGDTWWMGLCHRLHWPDEVKTLAADRKAKGFNVIQLVAGLYPDMHPFDPRGANEAGFPWEKEYARIRPEYFDAADKRIEHLVEEGFTPCIVGAWGYYMPWMGVEKVQKHWRYLIARYGAMPVVWCAAGEANLPWYLAKGFPYDDRKQVNGWTEVLRFIRETDPYRRPLTIHPTGLGRWSARHCTDDVGLLDFDMLQTPHGQRDAVPLTLITMRESYADQPIMPVIDGEASYEMLSGTIKTEWTRRMFWTCMMNGAAGHTYGANGIWQCNRKGEPHGPSPTAGSPPTGYGTISWDEAMNLGGSRQVGLGKKLFEQFDWQKFQPHPEWAEFATKSALSFEGSQWIWFAEGKPAENAPAAKRFFRRKFEIPAGKEIKSAQLRLSADDRFDVRLNGKAVGTSGAGQETWRTGKQFDDIGKLLKSGGNVLAIEAENLPAPGANPAGLILRLEIRFNDGSPLSVISDGSWISANADAAGWDQPAFDDAAWGKAIVLGAYGASPWGAIDPQNNSDIFGPQSTGIPGVVRLTYVPEVEAVVLRSLGRRAGYSANWFDPVSGETKSLPPITANDDGSATCPPPRGHDHDWVLILEPQDKPRAAGSKQATLSDDQIAWHLDWTDGRLVSLKFDNKISGHSFALSQLQELGLVFSAAVDQAAQPLKRVTDFKVINATMPDAQHAEFQLRSESVEKVDVSAHLTLDGPTRRKWVDVTNRSDKDILLLDVELDDLVTDGIASGGGEGQPVFLEGEAFAAIEHPAGVNQATKGRIQLAQYPGRRLAPGATYHSPAALVSVAQSGQASAHFLDYIQEKSRRPKKAVSIYTPLGINNLWGGCPTLNDEETLDVLNILEKWQKKGVHFDYFTLDTGWVDPSSDLTRFRPSAYPSGPKAIVDRVKALNMKFGLWFATSWGAQSAWDHPAAFADRHSPGLPWREGYPITREGIQFCIGEERYHQLLKKAVLYHIRENNVRLFKFDGGDYTCDHTEHGHLPGKYSAEPRMENLIDIADAARAAAPDVFIMWYWGLRSPFWALHGDMLFESGLMMEGSATSAFPALNYRDSVNLAQDQNAQYARNIPPIVKDSLGVWLADDRWGNYMGKQRWREAMIMDVGRGNLFAPNLWGDIYSFNDGDVDFLSRTAAIAKKYEQLLLHRKKILGDPWRNDVYGYAYGEGSRALLFANNIHFASRPAKMRLDSSLGLESMPGTPLSIISHFPQQTRLMRPDGAPFKIGDALEVSLRPFESLMLEVMPAAQVDPKLPPRNVSADQAADLGVGLKLTPKALDARMDIRFADAARFEGQGFKKKSYEFESVLPSLDGAESPILAVVIRLRKDGQEWRHKPPVVQIAQAIVRIEDQMVQLHPVPDSRQYGNTQGIEGCSWVTYKVRLSNDFSKKPMKIAVHAYLPEGVEAKVETWVVKRWWEEDPRPTPNGYCTDEPS
jgi:hypothetical protein